MKLEDEATLNDLVITYGEPMIRSYLELNREQNEMQRGHYLRLMKACRENRVVFRLVEDTRKESSEMGVDVG